MVSCTSVFVGRIVFSRFSLALCAFPFCGTKNSKWSRTYYAACNALHTANYRRHITNLSITHKKYENSIPRKLLALSRLVRTQWLRCRFRAAARSFNVLPATPRLRTRILCHQTETLKAPKHTQSVRCTYYPDLVLGYFLVRSDISFVKDLLYHLLLVYLRIICHVVSKTPNCI